MASLERLAWLDESQAFNVIGVSTDDFPARARAALNAGNATIANFIDSQLRVEHMLGATRLPLTVLVDKDGLVLGKHYGARAWDAPDARAWIASLFGMPSSH